jgi:hypothetical protein
MNCFNDYGLHGLFDVGGNPKRRETNGSRGNDLIRRQRSRGIMSRINRVFALAAGRVPE